jgi:hypothetical protein
MNIIRDSNMLFYPLCRKMKTKFHSFTKLMFKSLMSALIFVSFVLLGGVVLLARTSNSTALSSLKAEVNDNKLSATNRNALLDYIAKMDVELQALSNGSSSATSVDVPAGAVMAFDLSTCPNGWTRFSAADNRFIMGATSNSKETGGSGSVMLQANQMAPHSHWFADSFFSEAFTYAQHSTTPAVGFRAGIDTVS